MLAYLDTKPELPTAFFVDNDLIAFGVMRALKDRGYRVPDDVSIVGFDDVAYCTVSSPALPPSTSTSAPWAGRPSAACSR